MASVSKSFLEEVAVTYMVQFIRLRRGVPVVVRTLHLAAAEESTALAQAKRLVGTASWPTRTDAVRVMDDGGRTLINWVVPVATAQPAP